MAELGLASAAAGASQLKSILNLAPEEKGRPEGVEDPDKTIGKGIHGLVGAQFQGVVKSILSGSTRRWAGTTASLLPGKNKIVRVTSISNLRMTQRHRDPSTLTHSLGRRRKTPIALNSESRIAVERRTCHKWSHAMLL